MTYRPEIDTFSDAVDITDDVIAFDFEFGLNMLSTDMLPNRLRTRATMLLDNYYGAWGEDELEGLGTIERRWKNEILFRGVVLDHEFDKRNALSIVKLAGARAQQQLTGVNLRTVIDLTPTELLAASGVTLTTETSLPSDISMKAGTIYAADEDKFINDFALFVDGYAYEDHLGNIRLLQKNDDRQPTLVINADEFDIEADSAEHLKKRGWRRDVQTIDLLDVTLDETTWTLDNDEIFRGNLPGFRHGQAFDTSIEYFFSPLSVQAQDIIDNFRFYELNDPLTVEGNHLDFNPLYRVQDYTAPTWINPENPQEIGLRLTRIARDTVNARNIILTPAQVLDHNQTRGTWNVTIRSFPTAPEVNRQMVHANEDRIVQYGALPELAWAINEAGLEAIAGRVLRAAENIPDVIKLIIPMVQETEAKFRSLVEHRIGSVSDVTFVDADFRVRGHYALLFVRMRWEEGRYNTIEMHLLKLREAERFPLHFESADQPIYFEDEDQPVEIQP